MFLLQHHAFLATVKCFSYIFNLRLYFCTSIGNTNDYNEMIMSLLDRYKDTKIVCVGFSLGGNLITKYLGELDREIPVEIIGAVSVCQGYCAIE